MLFIGHFHETSSGKSVPLARLYELMARACLAGCRVRLFLIQGEWNRIFVSLEAPARARGSPGRDFAVRLSP